MKNLKNFIGGLILEMRVYGLSLKRIQEGQSNFIIFAQGRTGSTLLTSTLNLHPSIHCDDELLCDRRILPRRYVLGRSRGSSKPVYGCHVKVYQISKSYSAAPSRKWLLRFVEEGWKVIYLRRTDVFRHAISQLIADHRKIWHVVDNTHALPKVQLELERVSGSIRSRIRLSALEAEVLAGIDHFEILYERDLLKPEQQVETFPRIHRFLGVEPIAVEPRLKRTTSDQIEESVENYAEVASYLKEIGLGEYLPSSDHA